MAINRLEKSDLQALYYSIFSGKFDEKTTLWEAQGQNSRGEVFEKSFGMIVGTEESQKQ